MYVVAVMDTKLAPDAIAPELGIVAYEARQRLALGSPAVVWTGGDRDQALQVLGKMRARDPLAMACDASAVVSSESMVSMRDFAFVDGGVTSGELTLHWSDVLCLLRASQMRVTETTVKEKQTNFSMGRAMATGGLLLSKTTSKDVTTKTTEKEQVLYLFRRSGGTPWLLRETSTRYAALGPRVAHASMQNFLTTTQLFRERAAQSVYDERLVTMRVSDLIALAGGVDLLAHL
ncbi:MAG: hypothetical protein ACXWP4_18175, partial [Polyangiales bacterium]